MEFCALESCGKCTPCRIGSTRGVETIDRIIRGDDRAANLTVLEDLCHTMKFGSLCALGGFTPYPVMSALTHFPEDFGAAASPGSTSPSPRLSSGRLRPSSTGYGEGRGEGAFPQAQTGPQSSDSRRGPLTRNEREERAHSDLSPQAGRGEVAAE
jgi:NADH-ubiquinone oxidoreductase-F iron-sulfur binding region